jgi:hypothetical protein
MARGAEFTSTSLLKWARDRCVGSLSIDPAKPRQKRCIENLVGSLRDGCPDEEIADSLADAP